MGAMQSESQVNAEGFAVRRILFPWPQVAISREAATPGQFDHKYGLWKVWYVSFVSCLGAFWCHS